MNLMVFLVQVSWSDISSFVLNVPKVLTLDIDHFEGNYIIAVSFMSEIQNPDSDVLKDYEQHTPTTVDSGGISYY